MTRARPTFDFERSLFSRGVPAIIGVDEVGRGCLAGPVVSAAVLITPELCDRLPLGIDDSKLLSESSRQAIVAEVRALNLRWGVGVQDAATIDRVNILGATRLSMREAIQTVSEEAGTQAIVLVDGNFRIGGLACPEISMIKGDSKSRSIALASILAKVHRDEWMKDASKSYAAYGFEVHKGYGTPAHREALRQLGPCALHRRSFLSEFNEQPRLKFGQSAEQRAVEYLISIGYRIIVRNWRTRWGELDIVAHHPNGGTSFIEVRATRTRTLSRVLESVTEAKRSRLRSLISAYIKKNPECGQIHCELLALTEANQFVPVRISGILE